MKKLKLGIIGLGNMGTTHAKSILENKTPEIELTAVGHAVKFGFLSCGCKGVIIPRSCRSCHKPLEISCCMQCQHTLFSAAVGDAF
ncbi:MAG: hypothetical protein RSD23_09680 [Ruthenibacterium sp.]